jgi:hypothetical protein
MQRHVPRPTAAIFASVLLVGAFIAHGGARAQDSSGTRAVPTYEAVGLYWTSPGANAATGCEVKFRKAGESAWRQGLDLWFDARNNECRGSLVALTPGTSYEVQMGLPGAVPAKALTFRTWPNQFPVARTVTVNSGSSTLDITEGGSASGYVVYQGTPGAVLDGADSAQYNVTINASYVILRGLTLKGAKQDAIRVSPNVTDVVIEDNDISGWGRTRDGKWGADMDSGVRVVCSSPSMERLTIQRNRIHSPRYSANSWTDGHPAGPQAVTISYCGGNHVIRHNEMYSANGNYFNDVIGGEDNFTTTGFPNVDTDIYANRLSHGWDDGIEAEGGNRNVRIWGNYIDRTAIGIATTITSVGPVYVFRNVFNRAKFYAGRSPDQDDHQPFFKAGSDSSLGNGRRYLFHNTMLQARESGSSYGLGGGAGIGGTGEGNIHNTVSMNNIYHLFKDGAALYQVGSGNTFERDMFNGSYGTAVMNGINARPTYASGNGWESEAGGQYALASGSPGHDQGARIANFNDSFDGAGPDVGAAEAGHGAMKFGLAAAGSVPVSTPAAPATPVTPTAPAPTPASPAFTSNPAARGNGAGMRNAASGRAGTASVPASPTPAPAAPAPPAPTPGTGTLATSSGLDVSSYSITAGQSVTFTVRLLGSAATPTGSVTFKANGNPIGGCAPVAVSNGVAACTTSAFGAGSYSIVGTYSGDSTYSVGQAGPITLTVTGGNGGSTAYGLTVVSSSYTSSYGQSVTFTVNITGPVTPTGTVEFRDGSTAIAGCSPVNVSGGVATCTTSALSVGSHQIRGYYSGDANNSNGIAGPLTQTVK